MTNTAPKSPVRLRPTAGVLLAVQWNLPLLLVLWYPWGIVFPIVAANCFVWSIGCFLIGRSPRLGTILFRPGHAGSRSLWNAATVLMAVYGIAALIIWRFER